MICNRVYVCAESWPLSTQAVLAGAFMADNDDNDDTKSSMKADFDPDAKSRAFFHEDDFDIYVNKVTNDTYIFHGPDLPYPVKRLEYDPATMRVDVVTNDEQKIDLGVKIQWLIRPYFTKASHIMIVQTKDGEAVDGLEVPLVVKETEMD